MPHQIAAAVCTINASASVLSTYRCWSRFFSTGRTAMNSVISEKTIPTSIAAGKPIQIGHCRSPISHAPKTAPSIPSCPEVKLRTFEVEYMTL